MGKRGVPTFIRDKAASQDRPKIRRCLKCDKAFRSVSPFNRVCASCQQSNNLIADSPAQGNLWHQKLY